MTLTKMMSGPGAERTDESVGVATIRYVFPGTTDSVLQIHIATIVTFVLHVSAQESTKL